MVALLDRRSTSSDIPMLPFIPSLEHLEAGILKPDGNYASAVEILRDGVPLIYIDLELGFEMPHFDRPDRVPLLKSNSVLEILVDGEVYYKGNSTEASINQFDQMGVFELLE